jgi:hypothetical protein
METSDGIAIIELQDRRIGCLLMMFLNIFFVWAITPFWQDSCERCWNYNPDNIIWNIVRLLAVTVSFDQTGVWEPLRASANFSS